MGLRKSQSRKLLPQHDPRPAISQPPKPEPGTPPEGVPSIYLAPGGDLAIFFPPSVGLAGHTCTLSASNPETMGRLLLRILAERAIAPRARIAENVGVPTQALLDALTHGNQPKVFRKVLDAEKLDDEDFF